MITGIFHAHIVYKPKAIWVYEIYFDKTNKTIFLKFYRKKDSRSSFTRFKLLENVRNIINKSNLFSHCAASSPALSIYPGVNIKRRVMSLRHDVIIIADGLT